MIGWGWRRVCVAVFCEDLEGRRYGRKVSSRSKVMPTLQIFPWWVSPSSWTLNSKRMQGNWARHLMNSFHWCIRKAYVRLHVQIWSLLQNSCSNYEFFTNSCADSIKTQPNAKAKGPVSRFCAMSYRNRLGLPKMYILLTMQRSIYLIYDDGSLYLLGSGALQFPNDDSKWSLLFWCEAWRSESVLLGKTARWSKTLKGGYKKTSSCLLQREIHLKLAILGHFLQSSSFLMQPPGEHPTAEFLTSCIFVTQAHLSN